MDLELSSASFAPTLFSPSTHIMTDLPIFTKIFKDLLWDGKNISGTGSSLKYTSNVRNQLPLLIKKYNIKTILDIPCGDMVWMSTIIDQLPDYIGADLVPDLLDRNRKLYPNIKFQQLDLITDPLPKVDLIICRDVFIHFTNDNVKKALANIKKSGSTYLLATTNIGSANVEIDSSILTRYRPVDLQKPPFNLPEPIDTILEYDFNKEYLGLWKVDQLNN